MRNSNYYMFFWSGSHCAYLCGNVSYVVFAETHTCEPHNSSITLKTQALFFSEWKTFPFLWMTATKNKRKT